MKDFWKRFKEEKISVNVRTKEEYDKFMKLCDKQGLKLVGTAKKPRFENIYEVYESETIIKYVIKYGTIIYSNTYSCKQKNIKIAKFSDIFNYTTIVITSDGKNTESFMKKNGEIIKNKKSKARLHPNDTYDFKTGAELALSRLFEEPQTDVTKDKNISKEKTVFTVGQRVKFKTWEAMEKEYGTGRSGDIDCKFCFTTMMKYLCGTFATIESLNGYNISLKDRSSNGNITYAFSTDMIEPAFKEVKRKAEVGEFIKIVNCFDYRNADVFQVQRINSLFVVTNGNQAICHREYVVLEEYIEQAVEEASKHFSGEVMCIKSTHIFTKGKIYSMHDGYLHSDNDFRIFGSDSFKKVPFKNVDEINKMMRSKFIEVIK